LEGIVEFSANIEIGARGEAALEEAFIEGMEPTVEGSM
jgi:hypothetical protein